MLQRNGIPAVALRAALLLAVILTALPGSGLLPAEAAPVPARLAATNALTLNVISARTEPRAFGGAGVSQGAPVTAYKYIINIDNTGTTDQRLDPNTGAPPAACSPSDPGYPASCHWVSIAGAATNSPIYTQGDQSDFAGGGLNLPNGRYLISVLADGYKLDGAHFTVPLNGPVTVELQPTPLPDATIRTWVFEDISPSNSAPDAPAEHGLGGFQGHILDYLGEVTTDVYGNPLCTRYQGENPDTFEIPAAALDAEGLPVPNPAYPSGQCFSKFLGTAAQVAANPYLYTADPLQVGMLAIPHVGTNRYALSAVRPAGTGWVQTTTLEGNHDWDSWVMEGATGYDTEFVVGGEQFPATFFGFVKPTNTLAGGAGHIKGVVTAAKIYVPTTGGAGLPGTIWGGMTGMKPDHPIDGPWIALSDLNNGDTAVYVGRGGPDGSFDIANVPDGSYTLTYWDEPQDYILDLVNVTVANGQVEDLGVLPLTGWWATLDGYVFNDTNRNGVMDPGEKGLPNFTLTMRKRENSLMDRGATVVTTDATGHYYMENAYPMTQWLVEEAYHDLYYTTGVTYQADNQPTPTTVLGAGVDVSVLPIIGLSGRLDWGVHAYDPTGANAVDPRNGGIVGTVSYDTTRNELDPRYAAVEDWQPGVSGLTVGLYAPIDCGTHAGIPCSSDPIPYELAPDGSYARGTLLNTYVTETWQRPGLNDDGECIPRDVNGNELVFGTGQLVTANHADCLEGPLMGVQYQKGYSTVDGNYGFGEGCFLTDGVTPGQFDPTTGACSTGAMSPLPGSYDYLVHVEIPNDAQGRPTYKVTREEDINIANGDQIIPQVPPPACAGPLHTVDVAGLGTDGYGPITLPNGIVVPASTPTDNPTFLDIGASPYEGQPKPLCDTKLVTLNNGKSIVPTFNLFTDVPIPGRFWGLLVDDLNFSSNPRSLLYGEKAGVPFGPVGIYDFNNRLVYTAESDYNGLFDVLLPSTNRISCPTPSGVCANLYRFVGNDPGTPGRLNTNYNPQFRTIAAEFEAFPGLLVPADLAPTQVGVTVQLPGGQVNSTAVCALDPAIPQLYAVSQPYVNGSGGFTIQGKGFGAAGGRVTLDGTIVLPTTSWSDTSIQVTVPANTPAGPHQLAITAANGQSTVNGLTFHVLGGGFAAFPANTVLDNFNRTGIGNNWNADNAFTLNANNVRVTGTGTMRWGGSAGGGPAYGANQEAYFTFVEVSPTATEQGLFLKVTGSGNNPNPTANSSAYIEVSYKATAPAAVQVRTKASGTGTVTLQGTFPVTFANGNQLGARALADGTVIAYQNGTEIGRVNVTTTANPWPAVNANGGGRLGIRFVGAQNNAANDARFDDFGGGSLAAAGGYAPNVYEVGPGRTYAPADTFPAAADHAIQRALNAAAASPGDDLVVVYPNNPSADPRLNPRGAYYENLLITSPVKLQGVGPGSPDGSVRGSIIDGGAFAGDSPVFNDWYTAIAGLTWDGNQTIYDGAGITLLAHDGAFGSTYKAAIDGLDIRGGDQQGFPGNINQIGGLPTGLPANVVTQGGAIFANAYARYLQITNNLVQNNGGGYGTIRIGTPNLPAPDTNQHNENVRIANNRIFANAGTNLAGGIGLFAGSDNYEVAQNDICGNFSAEYGGGLTVYGLSPNGQIHHNRIYFNQSYDEGGGIMIAGELPANPAALSPGSGPADIYNNLIQANLANDDGGGLRFLMAGNFPFNVYNNIIAGNVSTHEGGGVGINDAPAVRFYNNTVMKNLTTATAVTSNGQAAPAGLSTSMNSAPLQAALPGGSPAFSNPLLFNNIFWDNRAGTRALDHVTGIGAGGPADINNWDMGVADGPGSLSPTNSVLQVNTGINASPTNVLSDPLVVAPYDIGVTFNAWRNNPNFIGALLVAVDLPTQLTSDYHIQSGSPALNTGAASKTAGAVTVNAPGVDIDNQNRPAGAGFDIGADEQAAATPNLTADLSVTVTDGQTSVAPGSPVQYTIVTANAGPDTATGATVVDSLPAALTGAAWACTATAGSSCAAATGTGNINTTVNLLNGGSATFVVNGTVAANAGGTLDNTASVAAPAGTTDPNTANNSATDSDTIATAPQTPVLPLLDNFNRANAFTLGSNWSQGTLLGRASIRVDTNQASAALLGSAIWNGAGNVFGAHQGAAFTFANAPVSGLLQPGVILKASGGTANNPANYIRVTYNGAAVTVATTTNGNNALPTFTTRGTFPATFAQGDALMATVDATGTVTVYKTSGGTTTQAGSATISGAGFWTGTGRIGLQLPANSRVDDFSGGTLP